MDKKAIAEEIENEINASYRSKNLRQLIDILLSVITLKTGEKDLAGIEERMYVSLGKIFDEDTSVSDIKLCLSNVVRIEPLLKKILFLVNEGEYDNVVQKNLGLAHVIGVLGVKTPNLAIPLTRITRIKSAFVPLHIAKIYILKLCLDEEIISRCRFPCSRGYFRKYINWQKKQ